MLVTKKVVVLYSGGLDSRIMMHYAEQKHPTTEFVYMYWDYGHNAAIAEREVLPPQVIVRSVDWFNKDGAGSKLFGRANDPSGAMYIPGRNLVFTVLAACQMLPDEIWLGALAEEDNPVAKDKNTKFRKMSTELMSYVLDDYTDGAPIKLVAPFVDEGWSKTDAIRWAVDNGLPLQTILDESHSCYHIHDQRTNRCGSCKQCLKQLCYSMEFGVNLIGAMAGNPFDDEMNIAYLEALVAQLDEEGWDIPEADDFSWAGLIKLVEEEPDLKSNPLVDKIYTKAKEVYS